MFKMFLPLLKNSKIHLYIGAAVLLISCVAVGITVTTWCMKSTEDPLTEHANVMANLQLELQAIRELHSRLDDDKDGQVDSEESEEFAREELLMSQSTEKCKKFHKEEPLVSSDELWSKWQTGNKAHNWSCDQVLQWLKDVVEVPELIPLFREQRITGRFLPLIATNSGQFLNSLNISRHTRTKLQIKAMDIVLFGPPPSYSSYWKDTVMVMCVCMCAFGLAYAWKKQSSAHAKIDKFLEEIRDYESELTTLRTRLSIRRHDSAATTTTTAVTTTSTTTTTAPAATAAMKKDKKKASSFDSGIGSQTISTSSDESRSSSQKQIIPLASVASEPFDRMRDRSYSCSDAHEHEALRLKIWELESQLEATMNDRLALKSLLQESCNFEWSQLDSLRRKAEEDVAKAQKVCDKIKNKRSSVIGAFRLANSSTLEDAGLQITRAVNKMHRIAEDFNEYHTRWRKIETFSHLSLSITPRNSYASLRGLSSDSLLTRSKTALSNITFDESFRRGSRTICGLDPIPSPGMSSRSVSGESLVDSGDDVDGRLWQIGSSVETLERIEEEGSNALRSGSGLIQTGSGNNVNNVSNQSDHSIVSTKKPSRLNGFKRSFKLKNS